MDTNNLRAKLVKRIAFGHKARSGKDTSADYLVARLGYTKLSFAGALYRCTESMQRILGKPVEKDRCLLQELGMLVRRHYGADTWVNIVLAEAQAVDRVVVSDVRFKNEADALRAAGFVLVKIVRENRTAGSDVANAHISECELDDYPYDVVIENNGSIEELYETIDNLVRTL